MLGSAQRLRRSSEFTTAVRTGRRAGRGALVVHLARAGQPIPAADPDQAPPTEPARAGTEQSVPTRAGFIVSAAVGPAVVRNKVRRRLRHLVRERLSALPAGSTLVVRALPGAAELSYVRLAADLDAALAAAQAPRKPRRMR
ncbi:MAG TPA: ribonuclease P protein component [Micromonosporaceae bacterium]|nr:ribonuclease P protein component [Micromonosporaceae bacterium]